MIKMVQAMRHGLLPSTLHADDAFLACGLVGGRGAVLTEPVAWDVTVVRVAPGSPRLAYLGTNAHVILEEAPRCRSGRLSAAKGPSDGERAPIAARIERIAAGVQSTWGIAVPGFGLQRRRL